jgi:hypothetical protein
MHVWTGKNINTQWLAKGSGSGGGGGRASSSGLSSRPGSAGLLEPIAAGSDDLDSDTSDDEAALQDLPDDCSEYGFDEACAVLEALTREIEDWASDSDESDDVAQGVDEDGGVVSVAGAPGSSSSGVPDIAGNAVAVDPDANAGDLQQVVLPPVPEAAHAESGGVGEVAAGVLAGAAAPCEGAAARARQRHGQFVFGNGWITLRVGADSLDVHCQICKAKFDRKNYANPRPAKKAQGRPLGLMFYWLTVECTGDPDKQQKKMLREWSPLFDFERPPHADETRGEPFWLA